MNTSRQIRFSRRTGLGLFAAAAVSPFLNISLGAAQEATPSFTPVMPAGPLGEQIFWLLGVMNGSGELTEEIVTERFAESFLVSSPASEVVTTLEEQAESMTEALMVPGTLVVGSRDDAVVAAFELAGAQGHFLVVSLGVEEASGKIVTLGFIPGMHQTATPAAEGGFPSGPLGVHTRWLLDVLNAGPDAITSTQLAEHFTPEFLAENPADQMLSQISALVDLHDVWLLDQTSIVSAKDLPPTVTRFVVNRTNGDSLLVSMTLDRDSGLLSNLELEFAVSSEATPVN